MLGEPGDISRRLKERNRLDQRFFEKVERVFTRTARTNDWGNMRLYDIECRNGRGSANYYIVRGL